MRLTYSVTEAQYLDYLTALLKRRDRSPLGILLLLLTTVGQAALCVFFTLHMDFAPERRWSLWGMSALIAALSCFRRLYRKGRAKNQLARNRQLGNVRQEVWQPHELLMNETTLRVRYGKEDFRRDMQDFVGCEEEAGLVRLRFRDAVLDLVPADVLDEEKRRTLAETARERRRQALAEEVRAAIPEEWREKLPEDPELEAVYAYPLEDYCRHQLRAHRGKYASRAFWTAREWTRVSLSALSVTWAVMRPSALHWVVAVLLVAVLNLPHLLCFSPLMAAVVRRDARPLYEGRESRTVHLYATADRLTAVFGAVLLEIPAGDITFALEGASFFALFLRKGAILTIPREALGEEQAAWISDFLRRRAGEYHFTKKQRRTAPQKQ